MTIILFLHSLAPLVAFIIIETNKESAPTAAMPFTKCSVLTSPIIAAMPAKIPMEADTDIIVKPTRRSLSLVASLVAAISPVIIRARPATANSPFAICLESTLPSSLAINPNIAIEALTANRVEPTFLSFLPEAKRVAAISATIIKPKRVTAETPRSNSAASVLPSILTIMPIKAIAPTILNNVDPSLLMSLPLYNLDDNIKIAIIPANSNRALWPCFNSAKSISPTFLVIVIIRSTATTIASNPKPAPFTLELSRALQAMVKAAINAAIATPALIRSSVGIPANCFAAIANSKTDADNATNVGFNLLRPTVSSLKLIVCVKFNLLSIAARTAIPAANEPSAIPAFLRFSAGINAKIPSEAANKAIALANDSIAFALTSNAFAFTSLLNATIDPASFPNMPDTASDILATGEVTLSKTWDNL